VRTGGGGVGEGRGCSGSAILGQGEYVIAGNVSRVKAKREGD
jgi:hypothetical protein